MITLHVAPAQGDAFAHDVEDGEVVIGRSMKSDLSVADRFLSRQHARLYRTDQGWMIEDLGSRNGTFVNGVRVESPTTIAPGDVIAMSASIIKVTERGDAPPATDRPRQTIEQGSIFRPATELIQASIRLPAAEGGHEPDDIRRHAEQLSILNDVHQTLATSISLDELLDLILDRTFDHLRPEQGVVLLKDKDDGLYPAASRPLSTETDRIVVSQSLAREVVEKGMAALVHDVRIDDRFAEAKSLLDAGIRSVVAAPLSDPRGTLGMIALSSAADVRVFSPEDMQLLSSLASVAALRIRNIALAEEAAERRRLHEEVKLARQIQVALIPDSLPPVPGYEIYGGNQPSQGVSGDYYEVIERLDGRECVFFIADVSGKGIAASLLTAYIEALSSAPIEDGLPPDQVFARVSRRLYRRTPHERFATAFLAILNPASGTVRFANAGHNPALLVRRDGTIERLSSTGLPLGLLPLAEYECTEIALMTGDTLVTYTDGITEATNTKKEEYGTERLEALCHEHLGLDLGALAAALEEDLQQFVAGEPFADDRTLVMLRRVE
jgi:serine phosphatase RsbU (regulator of sigma subunit)